MSLYPENPPPIGMHVEVEKPDGTRYRHDAQAPAEDRPVDLSFGTQRGDGFAAATARYRRRIDRDYPDLQLRDTVRFVLEDGFVVYEGRVEETPRNLDADGHSIELVLAGWMTHAKQRKVREIYIDRDLSKWGPPVVQKKANDITGGVKPVDGDIETDASNPAIATRMRSPWPAFTRCEVWYDSGGIPIGLFPFNWKRNPNVNSGDANWIWEAYLAEDALQGGSQGTGNLRAAGPGAGEVVAANDLKRFAVVRLQHQVAIGLAGVGDYTVSWNVAIKGGHSLTQLGAQPSEGYAVSDMIRDSGQRFAPKLDYSEVRDTAYPVKHAVPDGLYAHDFWLELNNLHLWNLSVWEGRKLHFEPPSPLDDYDWEVRTDDPGVRISLVGEVAQSIYNGAEVTFTDLRTGKQRTIDPDTNAELAITDPDNLINRQGEEQWVPVDVPFPMVEEDAIQVGLIRLAEANQPKQAGRIAVGPYIRDRAGNWQQSAKVRCDERIAITNHPNARPRRIVDTNYVNARAGRQLEITVDSTSKRFEAIVARIALARQAAGLS